MCSITQAKDQIQKSIGECVMSILSFLVEAQGNSIALTWKIYFLALEKKRYLFIYLLIYWASIFIWFILFSSF